MNPPKIGAYGPFVPEGHPLSSASGASDRDGDFMEMWRRALSRQENQTAGIGAQQDFQGIDDRRESRAAWERTEYKNVGGPPNEMMEKLLEMVASLAPLFNAPQQDLQGFQPSQGERQNGQNSRSGGR